MLSQEGDRLEDHMPSIAQQQATRDGAEALQVNIESQVEQEKVPNMFHFVECLRGLMMASHPRESDGLVLWYDACDIRGCVAHQCTLNEFNAPFFAVRCLTLALAATVLPQCRGSVL